MPFLKNINRSLPDQKAFYVLFMLTVTVLFSEALCEFYRFGIGRRQGDIIKLGGSI
jgi:hypothetical protein